MSKKVLKHPISHDKKQVTEEQVERDRKAVAKWLSKNKVKVGPTEVLMNAIEIQPFKKARQGREL